MRTYTRFSFLASALLLVASVFAGPGWKRVNYTNSTIFTGIVTVNGVPAKTGDVVGIFVNGECRMVASVFTLGDTVAYVSAVLHGESTETATIKYWNSSENKVYDADATITTNPTGEIQNFPIRVKSVEEPTNDKSVESVELSLYPTPVQSNLNISFGKDIKNITIVNNIGKLVLSTSKVVKGLNTIDLSGLASGLYFVSITSVDGNVLTKKIIKN